VSLEVLILANFLQGNIWLITNTFFSEVRKVVDFLIRKKYFREFPANVTLLVYAHPSLFAVWQMLRVDPRVNIYTSRFLQLLLGTSELFDNSNRYSNHTAWRSRNLNKKNQLPITRFLQRKDTKNIWGGGGRSVIKGFSLGVLESDAPKARDECTDLFTNSFLARTACSLYRYIPETTLGVWSRTSRANLQFSCLSP